LVHIKYTSPKVVKENLCYLNANYGFLSSFITKLETSGLLLHDQLKLIEEAQSNISAVSGPFCSEIQAKLTAVVLKNKNFKILQSIANMMQGKDDGGVSGYTIKEVSAFKYAQITSVEVERCFSSYKSMLRDNRQSFLFENLKEYFITYCNNIHENI